MTANIESILAMMRKNGSFSGVERIRYDLTAETLLEEVKAVGRERSADFTIDKPLEFAYTNIAKWITADPTMQCINPITGDVEKGDLRKGIYLAGRTGCGKTWAFELFGYLARLHRLEFRSDGKPQSLDLQDFRADDMTEDFMKDGEIDLYVTKLPCLVINDLGTEPSEVVHMGNRVDVVRQVLEKRADYDNLLTCITSNIPMKAEALVSRYGDRVASRLRKMCNYIEVNGPDRRR